MADMADALAYLQNTDSTTGGNVYDHLTEVISGLLQEKPDKPVDLFAYSILTKKLSMKTDDTPYSIPTKTDAPEAIKASLYSTPTPPIDPDTGVPVEAEPPNEYESENTLGNASLFEAAGVGLAKSEMYSVMLAEKALGEDPEVKVATVRFFGKFLGTHMDYYVFETTLKEPPAEEGEAPEGVAPPEAGTGANGYTYFATTALGVKPTMLPSVTPQAIVASRGIKKYFTGDLAAEVSAYPPYPGGEAMYLRSVIARIAATTVVCPAGFFSLDPEDESGSKLIKSEEYAAAEALNTAEAWCYRYPHIKPQGRCEFWEAPQPEVPEGEEPPPAPEPEVSPALLTPLTEAYDDVAGDFERLGSAAWAAVASSSVAGVKYQVTGVTSLLWPGASAVALGSSFANVYVGYGIKSAPFVPAPPPAVNDEYDATLVESVDLPPRPDAEPVPEEEA